MQDSISCLSPAKLNLGLKIIQKLTNNYHEINTTFCLIDLYDTISCVLTNEPNIILANHNNLWSINDDLMFRAAKLLQQTTKTNFGVKITINKSIPVGAGLGGGSSDAASILVILNKLWNLNLPINDLSKLAKELGADVPFFIYGKNAFATGIGECLTPIYLPQLYFVIVKPHFSIATADVFKQFVVPIHNKSNYSSTELLTTMENDLQPVASKMYPELNAIINNLQQYGTPVMTGSGSAVFLQFDNYANANKVASLLKNSYNTFLVKSLNCSPLNQILQ
jgi:4-diphosphocytidyl-2-C-methyl-D-erythritol kinase